MKATGGARPALKFSLIVAALFALALFARAADPIALFDQANRLYEQGRFSDAAAGYEKLVAAGQASATVYYNLGNAWFKAGQLGRAVAAYRHAQDLAPRDPNIRFNLNFARRQITGAAPAQAAWQRWLSRLTVNEWTVLASAAVWLFFGLMILREWHAGLRRGLRAWTAWAGGLAAAFSVAVAFAVYDRARIHEAVVVAQQAVVRYGPLEDSRVHFQLRDGSEIVVLDEKRLTQNESWLQVRDGARRIGWLKREDVMIL